ncbi:hypothetical protein F5B22DRAFT_647791 [Xylaria bambusicola]|uniref:uncharacterized protein n=1 Tax=Xylaria bambusicola TaxID=326684 RepID=UPI002008BCD0|nr:uncharacterized protein F5B22DRAFT_647791 [Xylaria bambusicola]KAI0513245.1 hypothetical protein F5B22DRAFT_647791 [Xylaria bambusicola]
MSHSSTDSRSGSPDFEAQQRRPLRRHLLDDPDAPLDFERLERADDSPPPLFMQDQQGRRRLKWVPYPPRKILDECVKWVKSRPEWAKGPDPPKIHKINPLFPQIQHAHLRLFDRVLPEKRHRLWLLFAYVGAWIITFALVFWQSQNASKIEGWGMPSAISCGTSYWNKNDGCGLDGVNCRPFDNTGFAFRCPANCGNYRALNPRAVGTQEIVYAPLIVGGPPDPSNDLNPVYRGDSYICGAAIHSGIISSSQGGCGVVSLIGEQRDYVASKRHGIESFAFDSNFPLSFTFLPGIECDAKDVRWSLFAISVTFTAVLSLFTTSSAAFFFTTFIITFWQVGLASDRPLNGAFAPLFSNLLGKFLPAMFCAWVFYDKMGVRRILRGLTAQVEKTILWLGACWTGALTNYTFDAIPISRLTGHDLNQQPGAIVALSFILFILVVIIIFQAWDFQQEGRFIRYLKLYALLLVAILVALPLPGLELRLHHYILALLLLPGTSIQTHYSLVYQGLLVGFFVNGIARWGFDPVLQTQAALLGDGQLGSALPTLLPPIINDSPASITFKWETPSSPDYMGISILVNDVERFRGYFGEKGSDEFVWTRDNSSALNEYFRFAYVLNTSTGDFTKAGTWNAALDWVEMKPGPSRVKGRSLVHDDDDERVNSALCKRLKF